MIKNSASTSAHPQKLALPERISVKKSYAQILTFFVLITFILGGTVSPVYADTFTAVKDCVPGSGMMWRNGPSQPKIAAQAAQKLSQVGITATVKARSYGETDSCGTYIQAGIDFTVTLPQMKMTFQSVRQQAAKTILPVLTTLSKPALGKVTLIDSAGKVSPVTQAIPNQHTQTIQPTDIPADAVFKKVYVIVYDPILSNGQKLSEYKEWSDYASLTQQTIDFFKDASGNRLNYSVVDTTVVTNEWPQKKDGFTYSETEYLAVIAGQKEAHTPDEVNYQKILASEAFDICGKANRGEIDEVWIYNAPYFGFYESTLAGVGAYEFNSLPIDGSQKCKKPVPIMGPSVEREIGEAIHNFGHRTEATMIKIYGEWWRARTNTSWEKFALNQVKTGLPYGGCGYIHYPTNTGESYDYTNPEPVPSNCADFANYPNLSDPLTVAQPVSCLDWNCTAFEYYRYWFNHLPSNTGCGPDHVANDWWDYIATPYLAVYPVNACQADMHLIFGNTTSASVTLTYTDGDLKTVTSDANGNYFLMVSNHWSGSIAAAKDDGYAATPASIDYTDVQSDQFDANYTVTANGPEIAIKGNGILIQDGSTQSSLNDQTYFGGTQSTSGSISRSFTIYNTGTGTLNLTNAPAVVINGANADDFSVTSQPASAIPPGGSSTFTILFDPVASGLRTASISILNNDLTENPYNFSIQGASDLGEIDIQNRGVSIMDGSTVSYKDDNVTYFGATPIAGGSILQTFTIYNTGFADLHLTGSPVVVVSGTNASDFSIITQPANTIPPAGSTTFSILYDPMDWGIRSASISIANDDPDENPYNFAISGRGSIFPEIDIRGNNISIPDGATIPSLSDDTDFGSVSIAGSRADHTFTIANTGDGWLSLTGTTDKVVISGPDASDFVVTQLPKNSTNPGSSTTFVLSFIPQEVGLRTASISIANSDSDENPYNFTVQGVGFDPPPFVVSTVRANADPTNANSVDFTVRFSEDVTGVDASDFALHTTDVTGASISAISGAYESYTVRVNTGSGNGSIRLDILDDDSIYDNGLLPLGGTGQENGNFTGGEDYTVDRTVPTVTLTSSATDPTKDSPIVVNVSFSKNVTDFSASDILAENGTVSNLTGNDANYQFDLTPSTNGTVTVNIPAGAAHDAAGNANSAAEPFSRNYNGMLPIVLSSLHADANPTSLASVRFIVRFSEAVTGVDMTDFTLTKSGVTGASIRGVSGSGATYIVSVNTGANNGKIRLDVLDDDTILDGIGNPLNGAFSGGDTYSVNKPITLTLKSMAAHDGWLLENKENSSMGGSSNSNNTTAQVGDDSANRQYRSILSFNTAALPDNAIIQSAVIRIKYNAMIGTNPFNALGKLWAEIKSGVFGTSPALQITDFSAASSAKSAVGIFNGPISNWYNASLNATGLGMLNKTGLTQFRLRFAIDDNNNHKANIMLFNSGNAASGQPELTIIYTLPPNAAIPKTIQPAAP